MEDAAFWTVYFIYFEQYLFRGAQFSEAGLNGALRKEKTTQKKLRIFIIAAIILPQKLLDSLPVNSETGSVD